VVFDEEGEMSSMVVVGFSNEAERKSYGRWKLTVVVEERKKKHAELFLKEMRNKKKKK